jgi:hypothetical protein
MDTMASTKPTANEIFGSILVFPVAFLPTIRFIFSKLIPTPSVGLYRTRHKKHIKTYIYALYLEVKA